MRRHLRHFASFPDPPALCGNVEKSACDFVDGNGSSPGGTVKGADANEVNDDDDLSHGNQRFAAAGLRMPVTVVPQFVCEFSRLRCGAIPRGDQSMRLCSNVGLI